MQRSAIATGPDLTFGPLGGAESRVSHHRDECVELEPRLDALQASAHELHGRNGPRPKSFGDLLNRRQREGHRSPWPRSISRSASRNAAVDRARLSRSGFNSGIPRRSASAHAVLNHSSMDMFLDRCRRDQFQKSPIHQLKRSLRHDGKLAIVRRSGRSRRRPAG